MLERENDIIVTEFENRVKIRSSRARHNKNTRIERCVGVNMKGEPARETVALVDQNGDIIVRNSQQFERAEVVKAVNDAVAERLSSDLNDLQEMIAEVNNTTVNVLRKTAMTFVSRFGVTRLEDVNKSMVAEYNGDLYTVKAIEVFPEETTEDGGHIDFKVVVECTRDFVTTATFNVLCTDLLTKDSLFINEFISRIKNGSPAPVPESIGYDSIPCEELMPHPETVDGARVGSDDSSVSVEVSE